MISVTKRFAHSHRALHSQCEEKNGLDSQQHKSTGSASHAFASPQQEDSCLLQEALPACHSSFLQIGTRKALSEATPKTSTDRTLDLSTWDFCQRLYSKLRRKTGKSKLGESIGRQSKPQGKAHERSKEAGFIIPTPRKFY